MKRKNPKTKSSRRTHGTTKKQSTKGMTEEDFKMLNNIVNDIGNALKAGVEYRRRMTAPATRICTIVNDFSDNLELLEKELLRFKENMGKLNNMAGVTMLNLSTLNEVMSAESIDERHGLRK